ncbi:hypothetical protein PMI12_03086 [Variovorax sp. CF313]|jgi:hypothetical protein|nr:hypothetical protein PMI12_03086 [Variovorax sp. CF313]
MIGLDALARIENCTDLTGRRHQGSAASDHQSIEAEAELIAQLLCPIAVVRYCRMLVDPVHV